MTAPGGWRDGLEPGGDTSREREPGTVAEAAYPAAAESRLLDFEVHQQQRSRRQVEPGDDTGEWVNKTRTCW
jgi:hypothetical protein